MWNRQAKIKSRQHMIDTYRLLVDRPIQHFYTLAGKSTTSGERSPDCEYLQLVNSKFITPEQFVGIDKNRKIISENKLAYPETNWHVSTLHEAIGDIQGSPTIINYDSMHFAHLALQEFEALLGVTPECTKFLSMNLILEMKRPGREKHREDINEIVNIILESIDDSDWILYPSVYTYGWNNKTIMGTFYIYKE